MMFCVTKAMPIHFIDSKCHIKQKSHKTSLTNHMWSISHHITPLVINGYGADTQTHTFRCANQETRCTLVCSQHTPGLKSKICIKRLLRFETVMMDNFLQNTSISRSTCVSLGSVVSTTTVHAYVYH